MDGDRGGLHEWMPATQGFIRRLRTTAFPASRQPQRPAIARKQPRLRATAPAVSEDDRAVEPHESEKCLWPFGPSSAPPSHHVRRPHEQQGVVRKHSATPMKAEDFARSAAQFPRRRADDSSDAPNGMPARRGRPSERMRSSKAITASLMTAADRSTARRHTAQTRRPPSRESASSCVHARCALPGDITSRSDSFQRTRSWFDGCGLHLALEELHDHFRRLGRDTGGSPG